MRLRLTHAVALLIMVAFFTVSCEKADHSYVNFENKLGVYSGNAYQYLKDQPAGVYDSLLKALDRCPELIDVLSIDSITVFALPNKSFELSLRNVNLARKDSLPVMPDINLTTIDQEVLQTYLARYILQGYYQSTDLLRTSDGYTVPSAIYNYPMDMQFASSNASGFLNGGPRSILFSDTNESLFRLNWVRVNTITVDIRTKNAVINILPETHDFGFGIGFIQSANNHN